MMLLEHRTLETKNIEKSFGTTVALENVNVSFSDQKIYGLFGRNGAGKTTLLNIISNRIFPDAGEIKTIEGTNPGQPSELIENCCYMPEKDYFPPKIKIKKLLALGRASFSDYDESYENRLCEKFKLNIHQKYEQLSRGHQSILRIVMGLASNAAMTIFDEPVLGLDAVARDKFYLELIEEFSRQPRLFIISTHLIEESSDLFNEAIILKNGSVIRQASIEDLLNSAFYVSGKVDKVDAYIHGRTVLDQHVMNHMKTVVVEGDMEAESPPRGVTLSTLTFQKLFIHLTNDDGE